MSSKSSIPTTKMAPAKPILASADFERITFTDDSVSTSLTKQFDHLNFQLENKKLTIAQRKKLEQAKEEGLKQFENQKLELLHFPLITNYTSQYLKSNAVQTPLNKSFFSINEKDITEQIPELLIEFSTSLNAPLKAGAVNYFGPWLSNLIAKKIPFLKSIGYSLEAKINISDKNFSSDLIEVENFILCEASQNPKRNKTGSSYVSYPRTFEGIPTTVIKRKKQMKESSGFAVSRFLVKTRFGHELNFFKGGKLDHTISSDENTEHFLLFEALFSEFDYQKLKRSRNPSSVILDQGDGTAWNKLKLIDVDFCVHKAPFFRVPELI